MPRKPLPPGLDEDRAVDDSGLVPFVGAGDHLASTKRRKLARNPRARPRTGVVASISSSRRRRGPGRRILRSRGAGHYAHGDGVNRILPGDGRFSDGAANRGTRTMTGNVSAGILAWGVYLPYWRLQRSAIGATLGGPSGRGTRAGRLLRRGHHHPGRRGARRALAALAGARPTTSTSPPRPRPTWTRPTPPPCTPPSNCPGGPAPTTCWLGAVVGRRPARRPRPGRRRGAPVLAVLADLRTGLAGGARGARQRRRRRGLRVRPGRGTRRSPPSSWPTPRFRRVPRPVAHPGRARLQGVGGALRPGG